MKKLLLFCSIVILMAVSCKKEDTDGNSVQIKYPASAVVIRDAVTDIDGNRYDAVQIGEQVWLSRNLCATRFADGTSIAEGSDISREEAFRYTPNSSDGICGFLYNWKAAVHGDIGGENKSSSVQGVCPNGWHLPSEAEWHQLTDYLSSHSEYVCHGTGENVAKAIAYSRDWVKYGAGCAIGNSLEDNNATGFSAVPVGFYPGSFNNYGYTATFWTSTESDSISAIAANLYVSDSVVHTTVCDRVGGLSVRCVRN